MELTPAQRERIRMLNRRWEQTLTPCGISRLDPYNPCLPEEIDGRIACITCFLWQQLEITQGGAPDGSTSKA